MSESSTELEGRTGWSLFLEMDSALDERIKFKYTSRRPQQEARTDAMLYAVIHHSADMFEPEKVIKGVEEVSFAGIPFAERERIKTELPLWGDAIKDAIEGKWDKMRKRLEDRARNAWVASRMMDDQGAFALAEAFERLAQSL